MNASTDLEPRNGDFVAYVDRLQEDSLEALKLANAYRMAHTQNASVGDVAEAIFGKREKSSEEVFLPADAESETAPDTRRERIRTGGLRPNPAFFFLSAFIIFIFASVFEDSLFPGSPAIAIMGVWFFFFIFAFFQKRRKR